MNWIHLTTERQAEELATPSEQPVAIIFKHSTSCSISRMALDRLERSWKPDEMPGVKTYFLDLLSYRSVSNKIAHVFGISHESPQVLMVKNGKVIYHESHYAISYSELKKSNDRSLAKGEAIKNQN
jgi:bacillithiol system protein YtxJ